MFKFKIKPKVKIKKLLKDNELEFKSIDTEIKYEKELDDDVTFKAEVKADLNYQKIDVGTDMIKSAEFSFTKKF